MPPWQLPTKLTCRTSARSLFQKSFLHKEDIIVQQYAPVVKETHIGNTIVNGEGVMPTPMEYVCYFIVDLFSGQVPKRRIIPKTNG